MHLQDALYGRFNSTIQKEPELSEKGRILQGKEQRGQAKLFSHKRSMDLTGSKGFLWTKYK